MRISGAFASVLFSFECTTKNLAVAERKCVKKQKRQVFPTENARFVIRTSSSSSRLRGEGERIPGPYHRNELVSFFLSLLLFVSYSHRPITPRDVIANAFFPCLSSEEE